MTESELREEICWWGRSMFERGLTSGTSGNISVRCEGGFLVTPTNSCLGRLVPERLSRLGPDWEHLDGDRPTKEVALHRPFYAARPDAGAVVHLHATHATALSCRADLFGDDILSPMTPYVVMKLGPVPVLPYARPGSDLLEPLIKDAAQDSAGLLLGNHGPIVSGPDLAAAASAIEELEEAAKLDWMLRDLPVRHLTSAEVKDLRDVFGKG